MQKLPFLTIFTSLLFSSTAIAADAQGLRPSILAQDSARIYGGVEVGAGLADYKGENLSGVSSSKSGTSVAGGALVGVEFGQQFIYGVEAAFNIHESRKRVGALNTDDHVQDLLWSSRLVGRVGYAMGAYTPFAFAGVIYGQAHVHRSPDYIGVGDVVDGLGFTGGIGVERQLTPDFTGRLAYHYEQYQFDRAWAGTRVIEASHDVHMLRFALLHDFNTVKARPASKAAAPTGWGGFYAGGYISGHFTDVDVQDSTSLVGQSFDALAGGVGVYGGYNFTAGQFVFGPEFTLDKQFGRAKKSAASLAEMNFEQQWSASARVRVGYDMGRVLPYVAAGVAYSQYELSMPQQSLTPVAGNWAGVEPGHGYVGAIGVDYKLMGNVNLRAEYNAHIMAQRGVHLNDRPFSVETLSHNALLGVGVQF